MSDLRKAAKMALKALENMSPDTDTLVEVEPHIWEYRSSLAIQALRQALTPEVTPEVTPEGWVKIDEVRKYFDSVGCGTIYKTAGEDRVPLYLASPTKEWVGLTDREIEHELTQEFAHWWNRHVSVCRAIETKLKDKNT
jgi:hypothetical protein